MEDKVIFVLHILRGGLFVHTHYIGALINVRNQKVRHTKGPVTKVPGYKCPDTKCPATIHTAFEYKKRPKCYVF